MDGDLMKEASRIWAMLDEMAENDPQKYRKFIDKQMEEGRRVLSPPEPHCVIQTALKNSLDSIFINLCSWSRIPEPKTDEDSISIIGGDLYSVDDNLVSAQAIGVACPPGIIKRYGQSSKNTEEKEGFIELIFQFLHEVKGISLSTTWTVLTCLDLKGSPEDLYKSFKFDPLNNSSQVDDIAKNVVPDKGLVSDGLLDKVNDFILNKEKSGGDVETYAESHVTSDTNVKAPNESKTTAQKAKGKVLIEEMPFTFPHKVSTETNAKLGRVISVEIEVEGISSVKDCDLIISKNDLRLKVSGSKGSVDITFPEEVEDGKARAQFKKKRNVLVVTVPVQKG